MLPPLALDPAEGGAVLDMCASPGSKTGLLAGLVGDTGFVLGNEPSQKRLGTLRRNLQLMNLFCAATCSGPGEGMLLPDAGQSGPGWDYILLDPPCSGWGTAEKNPQVLRLWQGDKLKILVSLQRRLIKEAARLLRPGGKLVYSTCTTNVEENEEQVAHAIEALGLELRPLGELPGFTFAPAEGPLRAGVWRVDTGAEGQGFFVALLSKKTNETEKGKATASLDGGEREKWVYLPRHAFHSDWLDESLLPPGKLALFNGSIFFLPEQSGYILPDSFSWRGFLLGRQDKSGRLRSDPGLRSLMPSVEEARKQGLACLDVDEPAPILALLSGQSLGVAGGSHEMGLYFRGLPLYRLKVKGKRAMLSPG